MTVDEDKPVIAHRHDQEAAHIPNQEHEPVLREEDRKPIRVSIDNRDPDMDPQLVWRGKRNGPLEVNAPPIYVQEHVHPKALIEDLKAGKQRETDLFGHFGLMDEDREAEVEFYRHTRKWSNRFILGDSLEVMTSLAEREGLRGKVQAIYVDPPYGIRFNSNFQWSTNSRDVKDGKPDHLTREPEQVRAFRDTWRDGIHSYLGYLRDRLVAARELLTESGSCFVQIGEENVHRVRALMDEVFGSEEFVAQISFVKAGALGAAGLPRRLDYVLWFAHSKASMKFREVLKIKSTDDLGQYTSVSEDDLTLRPMTAEEKINPNLVDRERYCRLVSFTKPGPGARYDLHLNGQAYRPGRRWWGFPETSIPPIIRSGRLRVQGNSVATLRYFDDFAAEEVSNLWTDTASGSGMDKTYVVQTATKVIERCLLMTTDPGDIVLDPTSGSGTTAHVAEHWGRRWIALDTSRVALALARARIMGAKYPAFMLRDSAEGQARMEKEGWADPSAEERPHYERDVAQGFVCERVPRITLKAIANNPAIDTLYDRHQPAVEDALAALNAALQASPPPDPFEVGQGGRKGTKIAFTENGQTEMPSGEMAPAGGLMEWEVPREAPDGWPADLLDAFWQARIIRQCAIDEAIERKGREDDYEVLHDKPFEEKKKVRVAGPFTVESLSPHRTPVTDEDGELLEEAQDQSAESDAFRTAVLDNLLKAGIHQAGREDRIEFDGMTPWPGELVTAKATYAEGDDIRTAAIFLGPEYGTVTRPDLVQAATEAADAGCDVLVACGFSFASDASAMHKLGRIHVLHARMNSDLHMAGELKAGGGNLFAVFGEPDIVLHEEGDKLRVEIEGVNVFRPATGEVVTASAGEIACWFVDTDYSGDAFFVRQAYFPGADVPYKSIKSALKADVDAEAWDSLKRTTSRAFPRPNSGRIAVKVINHLGDEVMQVLRVS